MIPHCFPESKENPGQRTLTRFLHILPVLMLAMVAGPGPSESYAAQVDSKKHETQLTSQVSRGQPWLNLSQLPLVFEENQGQVDPSADFLARVDGTNLLFSRDGVRIQAESAGAQPIRMRIIGTEEGTAGHAVDQLPGKTNYLLGSDPRRWVSGIGQAAKVQFDAVYPGIDVVYYGNQRRLEYDFVVAPGSDPGQIAMHFGEDSHPWINADGDLVMQREDLQLTLQKPFIYQDSGLERTEVAGGYRVGPLGDVGFEIGAYDPRRPLVIDPVVEYASYFGGPNDDLVSDVALDSAGNIYLTGTTSSVGLATEGAMKTTNQGGGIGEIDGFIAKLDPSGSQILYFTYIGGSKDDSPLSIAVDAQGNALVAGETTSEDFPTSQATQNQLGNSFGFGGIDSFALKLNSEGSALVYSTFLGGGLLELEAEIDVDTDGNAYIISSTTSMDLPVVNALQPTRGGDASFGPDAFVAKLSPTGEPVYITYLGGSGEDWGFGIAADSDGNAWVVGGTTSMDFPTVDGFENTHQGGFDAFVTKLSADGQVLLSSGFLGGSSDEMGKGVAVDSQGNVYVTGSTGSANFPLEKAIQEESMNADGLAQDAFVSKLSSNGQTLLYSTFFGGSGTDLGNGIAVGPDGSAFIAGETDSPDLPVQNAVQSSNGGEFDVFVLKLNPAGSQVDYATYLGGNDQDGATSLAVDAQGKVIVVGSAYSPNFPTTNGALQTSPASTTEGFIATIAP